MIFVLILKNIGHTGCQAISAQQQVPALQAQGITVTMSDDVSGSTITNDITIKTECFWSWTSNNKSTSIYRVWFIFYSKF